MYMLDEDSIGPVYDREGNLRVPEGLRMSEFELTWNGPLMASSAHGRVNRRESKVRAATLKRGRPPFLVSHE